MITITAADFAKRTGLKKGYVYQLARRRGVSFKDMHAVLDLLVEYESRNNEQKEA